MVEGKYDSGKPKVSIVLKEAFDNPQHIARVKARESGGPRPRNVPVCSDCGPEVGVMERTATTYACEGCGSVLDVQHTQEPVKLERSRNHPRECVPVEQPKDPENSTDAKMHRKVRSAPRPHGATLQCKNASVLCADCVDPAFCRDLGHCAIPPEVAAKGPPTTKRSTKSKEAN